MRLLTSALVAAGLLTSHVAGAVCVSPADREALDVAGLKTQLMVQTLTCKNDDEYNAFINKFKPEIVADERIANNYFSHAYGRASQKRHDEYMTSLANADADVSQKDGSRFCAHNQEIFKEVLALKNGSELKEFAAGRLTGQPAVFETCEATAPRSTRPAVTHRKKK
ncbi:MAG: hypothetical protein RQ966_07170 [Acetobacteraceae bacterium]|nr:hypothetical protein [Acetobacteraceae bacterium]